jgi:opacity protein-like surface antigen
MSKRWMMVAGALLLLCVTPQAVLAAAESMLTLTMGKQAPNGAFSDVARSGSMAGLSAGYRMNRRFEMGTNYNYFGNSGTHNGSPVNILNDPGTGRPVAVTLAESWRITNLGLYASVFVLERGRLAPYLRAGAGAYSIRYSQDVSTASAGTTLGGIEQASKAGFNAGAGMRCRTFSGTSIGFEALFHRIYTRDVKLNLWTTGVTIGFGPPPVATLAGAAAASAPAAGSSDASGDILKRGSQWMSVRAGYAKVSGDAAPNGLVGGGFGYRRFVLDKWSVGGFAHYELLGRLGDAAEIAVPFTLEVVRHARWGAAVYPYAGFGAGAFYHKRYRTGADESGFTPGRYLTGGMHVPVRKHGLIGLDVRMATVDKLDANPVFSGPNRGRSKIDDLLVDLKGPPRSDMPLLFSETESKSETLWSVKLDYSITY